jgi:GNAT superfamily N-acetyltransferase
MTIRARKAQVSDVPGIHKLMISLAEFESYSDQFNVSANDVEDIIVSSNTVHLIVVDSGRHSCVGLAVVFEQPFTYDMKPWLILKEFVVDEGFRGVGVGQILFQYLVQFAKEADATKIKWEVLVSNDRAKSFYKTFGSEHQLEWQIYQLDLR